MKPCIAILTLMPLLFPAAASAQLDGPHSRLTSL